MHCPECDHENRPGSHFCVVCGNPLPSSCPACGAKNEPGSRFCGQCGTPLAGDAATPTSPRQGLPEQAESPVATVDPEGIQAPGGRATGSAKWRPRQLQQRKSRSAGPPVWQRQRGFLAVVAGALILLFALTRLLGSMNTASPSSPATSSVPSPNVLTSTTGTGVQVARVLGSGAGLASPQEAVELPGGNVAVVDTGNARLVLLNSRGKVLKAIRSGKQRLRQPYAVATDGTSIYLLDAERGSIERYDIAGHFQAELAQDPILSRARGMSLGPGGTLYVASPGSNSVVVLDSTGKVLRRLAGTVGAGASTFNQPSDVYVAPNGSIYVLDNNNFEVKEMSQSGNSIAHWPAPPSTTLDSAHVLALPKGRLLISDPTGSLLLYKRPGATAVRLTLRTPGKATGKQSPLGLSLTRAGQVLVTDTDGNRVLVVSIPRA
jgi:Double zinc ribbon/NHL repeat